MFKKVYNLLSSTKLTIILIITFLLLFIVGQWIPQKKVLGELYFQWSLKNPRLVSFLDYIGFTDIYSSPLMIFLFTLFFLNLAFVMFKRIPVVMARIRLPSLNNKDISAYANKANVQLKMNLSMEDLKEIFKGYKFYGDDKNFIAIKNRYSPFGTIFFHLSFFLLLLGGLLTTYTRFSASLDLAEGEYFTGGLGQYFNPVKMPRIGSPPSVRFYVEKIEPVHVNDVLVDIRVFIRDEKNTQRIVSINRPFKQDYTSFVIKSIDLAPLFILYDKNNIELDGAYVKLELLGGKMARFVLAEKTFDVIFYPDFDQRDSQGRRSKTIKNPVFSVKRKDGNFDRVLIRVGEKKTIGDIQLDVPEMLYWVRFIVVKERGLGIVYSGFLIMSVALIMRLIFYRREFRGYISEDNNERVLKIGGRSEFYKAIFEDEFREVIKRLSFEKSH